MPFLSFGKFDLAETENGISVKDTWNGYTRLLVVPNLRILNNLIRGTSWFHVFQSIFTLRAVYNRVHITGWSLC
jgi:hypothetical protein